MQSYFPYVLVLLFATAACSNVVTLSCAREGVDSKCAGPVESMESDMEEDQLCFIQRRLPEGGAERAQTFGEIPKFVHHVYKVNLEFGPWPNKIWKASYDSWKKFFPEPEYRHFFWGDREMNAFFQKKCPQHWKAYDAESRDIVRSDLSRYCLLSKIGGIYADLDYEARQNFFDQLMPGMVNLIESPYQSESVQNSLMASPPGLPYWDRLMSLVDTRSKLEPNVLKAAGPKLLDELPETHNELMVHVLPCNNFQRATHLANGEEESAQRKACAILNPGVDDVSLMGVHWGTSVYSNPMDTIDIEKKFEESRKVVPAPAPMW